MIAVSDQQIDKDKTIVSAVATFEKAEHSAAESLALSGNAANRDHAKAVASAADQKWFSMAEEDADLAKDLAAEEETRQTAYASADAAWINAEAAAGVAATAVAATANYNYQTGAIGAGVTYVSATAPLVTQAQQQFNAGFHQAYVTATGNDPGQSAVSSAWQQYADNMAANYESLLTQAMTAWQAAGNAEAQAAQALQNNIAGESIPRASSLAGAWTTYVGAVAPAATTLANNLADTGKALVQTLSSHAKNADHQDADNNKALADADANAGKQLADDQTDAVTNAAQNALDAEKPHQQALIDEARDADQQVNGEVTVLAQGGVDEKVDLARDENNEARTAETQLASQDDLVHQAMVQRDQTAAILAASAEYEAISQALPITFEPLISRQTATSVTSGTLVEPLEFPYATQVIYLAMSKVTASQLARTSPSLINDIQSNLSRIGFRLGIYFDIHIVTVPDIVTTGTFFLTEHNMTAPATASSARVSLSALLANWGGITGGQGLPVGGTPVLLFLSGNSPVGWATPPSENRLGGALVNLSDHRQNAAALARTITHELIAHVYLKLNHPIPGGEQGLTGSIPYHQLRGASEEDVTSRIAVLIQQTITGGYPIDPGAIISGGD